MHTKHVEFHSQKVNNNSVQLKIGIKFNCNHHFVISHFSSVRFSSTELVDRAQPNNHMCTQLTWYGVYELLCGQMISFYTLATISGA